MSNVSVSRDELADRFEELINIETKKVDQFVVDNVARFCAEDKRRVVLAHLQELSDVELMNLILRYLPTSLNVYYSSLLQPITVNNLALICMTIYDSTTTLVCAYDDDDIDLFETTMEEDKLILASYVRRSSKATVLKFIESAEACFEEDDAIEKESDDAVENDCDSEMDDE